MRAANCVREMWVFFIHRPEVWLSELLKARTGTSQILRKAHGGWFIRLTRAMVNMFQIVALNVSFVFLSLGFVSSAKAFPYKLTEPFYELHDADRFHFDLVVDELDRYVLHNRRNHHHIRWLMEDSNCLSVSLVVRKTTLFVALYARI